MKEIKLNLWDVSQHGFNVICVTTNGITKANGEAVMGAGVAKQCAQRVPNAPQILGELLRERGNHVHIFGSWQGCVLLSFPTKHHWRFKSDLDLIRRSADELSSFMADIPTAKVALTRPGCGLGGLDWSKQVRPILAELLDDRFFICTP